MSTVTRPRLAAAKPAVTAVALAALGMVFGDIGTSPLYAMGLLFAPGSEHHLDLTDENILGVLSTIFWLVTLVVTVKYATLILRADNNGEGGVMALYTLLKERVAARRVAVVTVLTLLGASLFLGDSVITPAISVLSAVEGVSVVAPSLSNLVVPIVVGILMVLFAVQRFGTGTISKVFGPAMLVWFVLLAALGMVHVAANPSVVKALNPAYAVTFIVDEPVIFLATLSIILLTITGVEALYADMGHFGRKPIVVAWLAVAFPALMLNYFGQGAILLDDPGHPPDNLFYAMVPGWGVWPLTVVATCATVIAAQAVISGAFSLAAQATKLGLLPRLRIRYPGGHHGQVYVSAVNWALFVVVLGIVMVFGSSEKLASAYGVSVVACMLTDTILFFTVVRAVWGKPVWLVLAAAVPFAVIDVTLLVSCLPKLLTGGWMPVLIAATVFTALWTWHVGRRFVVDARHQREGSLLRFVRHVNKDHVARLPDTAIYLHPDDTTVPLSMRTIENRFNVVHDHALIVSVAIADVPHIPVEDSVTVNDLGFDDGIWHVELTFGFNDRTDVPKRLRYAVAAHPDIMRGAPLDDAVFYVSRFDTDGADLPGLAKPFERLFQFMKGWSTDPVKFFNLPLGQTVTVGAHLDAGTPAGGSGR